MVSPTQSSFTSMWNCHISRGFLTLDSAEQFDASWLNRRERAVHRHTCRTRNECGFRTNQQRDECLASSLAQPKAGSFAHGIALLNNSISI